MTVEGSPPLDPDRAAEAQYLLIERIAASEKRHREILAELPEIVVLLDEEGHFHYVNEAWQRLLGHHSEELDGQTMQSFIYCDDQRKWQHLVEAALENLHEPTDRLVRFIARDNRQLFMDTKVRRLDSGELVCTLEDFTARRRHEAEMLKKQRLESIGRLAGGLAHDFNNYLTIILGNLNVAQVKTSTRSPVEKELEVAVKACMQASGITKQMLTFSEGGAPVTRDCSLPDLIREAVELNLHGSKARVRLAIDHSLPTLPLDPGQIHQAVGNLLINAEQAMPDGGELLVRVARGCFPTTFSQQKSDPAAIIEVIDEGVGIPDENLDSITDPYYTTRPEGTGLGLTSACCIIHRHQGHYEIESTVGEGTTVRIYLPLISPQEQEMSPEPKGQHGRILIMDDNEAVLSVLESMLESLGHEVVATADGKPCVAAFKTALEERNPFDLVILDLTVPGGKGGRWTFRELREIDPRVAAVVASGYGNDNALSEPAAYGFKDRLQKPFLIKDLKQVVDSILDPSGHD